MATVISWALIIIVTVAAIAAIEWYQLFVRRHWRARVALPDPVAYTDLPSFRSDQEIVLRIHSSKPVRVHFNRMAADGWICVHTLNGQSFAQPRTMDRWHGFDWKPSATLGPNSLAPGFYRIDIEHQDDVTHRWCMALIVRDPTPQPVVVVGSTNTWNAYNDFGGLSNYADRATPQPLKLIRAFLTYCHVKTRFGDRHWLFSVPLPEARPNSPIHRDLTDPSNVPSHLAREETALIRFLEREAIPYTVISDRDFAFELPASGVRMVIFNTHSEYWSEEMIGRLSEFIHRDTSIAFLSGNNIYRKVQFMRSSISVIDLMTPEEEVVPLIGTYYDAYGFLTYDGYKVMDSGHWCFEGLSVANGTEFGHANANRPGASGYETDKIRSSPLGFRVVAIGRNKEGPAFMVCRDLPGGGFVFTVGSVSFTPCLDDDRLAQGLVRNLVRRALAMGSGGGVVLRERRVPVHDASESD